MTQKSPRYIIVGAEVDQAERWLHTDGTIDNEQRDDGQALNVEFIGRLMVALSKRGKNNVPKAELEKLEQQIRAAMSVTDFSGQGDGTVMDDASRDKILDRTTVRIEFETRRPSKKGNDRNTRILVVPSDETLEVTEAMLQAQGTANGFRPPLSYELDKSLMLASLKSEILSMTREFAARSPAGWTATLQAELETHMESALAERTMFKDASGAPADDVKNQIMASPLRAFHRSVGIYATNMCR